MASVVFDKAAATLTITLSVTEAEIVDRFIANKGLPGVEQFINDWINSRSADFLQADRLALKEGVDRATKDQREQIMSVLGITQVTI